MGRETCTSRLFRRYCVQNGDVPSKPRRCFRMATHVQFERGGARPLLRQAVLQTNEGFDDRRQRELLV